MRIRKPYKLKNAVALKIDDTLSERERLIRAAALIDGEGAIMIDNASLIIKVSSTTLPMLEWMQANYGGSIRPKAKGVNRKPAYDWVLSTVPAEALLRAIQPYTLIKGAQITCILHHRSALRNDESEEVLLGLRALLKTLYYAA